MNLPGRSHPYFNARAALLTQHGKERVVGPALREALAMELVVVRDFDTDTLGTFTRETPRFGTQIEAARRKAQIACERSGSTLGLGSEGSFGPGPFGFGSWNLEVLVLVDTERCIEVVGSAGEPGLHHHETVTTAAQLAEAVRRAGFPEHGVVLRPDGADHPRTWKGLRTPDALAAAFRAAKQESAHGRVFVENDLRAHQHPTRMAVIRRAAAELVERLVCPCPACAAPGFGRQSVVAGLPCAECGTPTEQPIADGFGCVACDHREVRPRTGPGAADPGSCSQCNP